MRPRPAKKGFRYTTDPPHGSVGRRPHRLKGPCSNCPHACKRCGSETNLANDPFCIEDASSRAFARERIAKGGKGP